MRIAGNKKAMLPSVRSTDELKNQVLKACDSVHLNYSTVINNLLAAWVSGKVKLDFDLDSDFVENAKSALESDEAQDSLFKLAKNYKQRSYTETIKI